MYGMINRALQEMVVAQHGDDTWQRILKQAGVDIDMFVRMETYPDAVTYSLVGVASEVLDAPVPRLLQDFGRYWVRYAAGQGYGPLLDEAGETLPEILGNLDEMHFRLGTVFQRYGSDAPNQPMQPPQFSCSDVTGSTLVLHYHSKRAGLGSMVIGLVEGLAERLGCTVDIHQIAFKDRGDDHDAFAVRHG